MDRAKIISFSVYGDNLKYLNGFLQNYELLYRYYHGWKFALFLDDTVPSWFTAVVSKLPDVFVVNVTDVTLNKMMRRFLVEHFLPSLSIERFIVRDSDSRLTEREACSVKAWEDSGVTLHIIRDHPSHKSKIMGGLWGLKSNISTKALIADNAFNFCSIHSQLRDLYGFDQLFLELVYNTFSQSRLVHASFNRLEPDAVPLPHRREDFSFCGEVYFEDNCPRYRHLSIRELSAAQISSL